MRYFCCNQRRRAEVKNPHSTLNGIDYLEVSEQTALSVYFLKPLGNVVFSTENFLITGGDRIRNIEVDGERIENIQVVEVTRLSDPERVQVSVNQPGDFSTYTLLLVRSRDNLQPPTGIDPVLSTIDFSFKVECPSDFDCRQEHFCPPEPQLQPDIDYLAKDYNSFRQLMLDRISMLVPQWKERNVADIGIALVELLAYVGDHLSYQQDAIATEAYLGTARRRTSVRRHARLVDYFMHDGCNARVWVQVQVTAEVRLPKETKLLTQVKGAAPRISPYSSEYDHAITQHPEVFETLHEQRLFVAHNQISFYTWSDQECCLPKGATRATLRDGDEENQRLQLQVGDVLIFVERLLSQKEIEVDAAPIHCHAVRLINVQSTIDEVMVGDSPTTIPIVEIEWHSEDALPFPFCISSKKDSEHGLEYIQDISVALGNIILVDHGRTLPQEKLEPVPDPQRFRVPTGVGDRCQERQLEPIYPRFNPRLQYGPVTHAAPLTSNTSGTENTSTATTTSATAVFQWRMQDVLPAIRLENKEAGWLPRRDLLSSDRTDRHFVAELEADGTTRLRFGDDRHGARPPNDQTVNTIYRIGSGVAGNVGAGAIAHIISDASAIDRVSNPLPAKGGTDPETIEAVRQSAPFAFRTQERAVTADDYARMAERHPEVQRAAATFRWTGSWRTVFVTIDRLGGLPVDAPFQQKIRRHLERYRMAGYDLEVDAPHFVSLEIEMQACIQPNYFRSDVKKALLQVFSNRILPDGRRGVFHPDNFTFGQAVYLSPLYAAAQAISGVDSVQITVFQRQGTNSQVALDLGKLDLARLEIARLDNDPNFPERGVLRLRLGGGK